MEYAIIYTPGDAWVSGRAPGEQPLNPHFSYVEQLRGERKIIQDTPFLGNQKVTVLDVGSEIEARDILRHDPTVIAGVLRAELTFWSIVFGIHADRFLPTRG